MQTLKSAVVVILLLVVFYGVYEVLNRPPDEPPKDVAWIGEQEVAPPDIQFGTTADIGNPLVSIPSEEIMPGESSSVAEMASSFPDSGKFAPSDSSAAFTGEPPSNPAWSGAPAASVPIPSATAAESMAPPGPASSYRNDPSGMAVGATDPDGAQIQHNQFFNESVVTLPNAKSVDGPRIGARAFNRAKKLAATQIEQGKYHDALFELSIFYKSLDLTEQEHRELLDLLDPLAAKVIYSREHLILPPYKVRRNETLMDIAAQHNIPWQLLQKINGIEKPRVLLPTSEIKVVPGPFQADVDLQSQQLTLFLGQLYAGRFPISISAESQLTGGEFKIRDKRENRDYFATNGPMIPASSPNNPFGNAWLDLGRDISIHGSPMAGTDQARGCISLSPRDAGDVYSILSVGSRVRIIR